MLNSFHVFEKLQKITKTSAPPVNSLGFYFNTRFFKFPQPYHGIRNPLTDFVRRRRWTRKCRIKLSKTYWKEIDQTHKISSFSVDQEGLKNIFFPNSILVLATDTEGFVLSSLLNIDYPSVFKWHHIPSNEKFKNISIGVNLRIWGISLIGNVYYR